jgi:hypothetical protein
MQIQVWTFKGSVQNHKPAHSVNTDIYPVKIYFSIKLKKYKIENTIYR